MGYSEILKAAYQKELIDCCTDKTRPNNKFDWERVARAVIEAYEGSNERADRLLEIHEYGFQQGTQQASADTAIKVEEAYQKGYSEGWRRL